MYKRRPHRPKPNDNDKGPNEYERGKGGRRAAIGGWLSAEGESQRCHRGVGEVSCGITGDHLEMEFDY